MPRFSKAALFGITVGICGLLFSFIPFVHHLEEDAGLETLFKVRGFRDPPPEVVIVTVDAISSARLNLPNNPQKWPHFLHAYLVDTLIRAGAKVIVFDIFFSESFSPDDDEIFSKSIRHAKNVILTQQITQNKITVQEKNEGHTSEIIIANLIPPLEPLGTAAAAVAPFPLPTFPIKVRQYWTFKANAGDIPTLPVVAYQLFTMDAYERFMHLLKSSSSVKADNVPDTPDDIIRNDNLVAVIKDIRNAFQSDPDLAYNMLRVLDYERGPPESRQARHTLSALIAMYQSPESNYLNFYGPARSIPTIPYFKVLQMRDDAAKDNEHLDFQGKAVFIGKSEMLQPEQKDGYNTVFSHQNGVDVSGVEIAATAFANLVENLPVRPLSFPIRTIVILLWGIIAGILCRSFSNIIGGLVTIILIVLYFAAAYFLFTSRGIWPPLVTTIFVQSPVAYLAAILCRYSETYKDRQKVRTAFQYYLPSEVIDKLSKDISDIKSGSQVVNGICLCTDVDQYTAISETLAPDQLGNLINRYYEAVFEPVKRHNGIISNVIADSMLALWVTSVPDPVFTRKASLAALDITRSVDRLNHSLNGIHLPTRIGLHTGQIFMGNIGAMDHYEYRPIGDIVNTTTRIEGLNKLLGTRILISDEVMRLLDGFLSRRLGMFMLKGKSRPMIVHELICAQEDCSQQQRDLCALFSEALGHFSRQAWEEASHSLNQIVGQFGDDGPSRFYLTQCNEYKERSLEESWNGLICVDRK